MFKKTTLKNGLRIIAVPQRNAQAVTVLALVATGSKYENKETSGISHFLEHMFFKGTKKRPTTIAIAETLDRIGGIYNAFTSEEYTGYFAKVMWDHIDLAMDWVSDIFLNSKLSAQEIKKEKGVIIEEINMIFDNPMAYVQTLWPKLLYGEQPAGFDIAGTKESVAAISRQKLLNYRQSQYMAENTVICLAGRFPQLEAVKKVKKYFGKIAVGEPGQKMPVVEMQSAPACLLKERKTDQTHLCLGVRAHNLSSPTRYVQNVLATILGGMMSSRLFIEVRERLGLAYYVSTQVSADTDTGCLVTQAGVDNKNVEKAILTILREYKKIARTRIPKAELTKAKDYLKGKMALVLEPSDARASFYGLQELLEKKALTEKEICDKINRVSASDVLDVARDIFRPQKLNLAMVGPFKDSERFTRLLRF